MRTTQIPGKHKLSECAEVQTGLAFSRKLEEDKLGTHQILLGRHLVPGQPYRYKTADKLLVVPERVADSYLANKGDIVLVARGAQNTASMLEFLSEEAPTIIPSTFFRIRTHGLILPEYLAWYLNQAPARQFIDSTRTGTSSPTIQKSRLLDLPIPVPLLQKQQVIVKQVRAMSEEAELRREAHEKSLELHAALSQQIVNDINIETGEASQP